MSENLCSWELTFLGFSSSPSPNGVAIVPGETFKNFQGETSKKRNPLQVWCSGNASISYDWTDVEF